MSIILIRHAEAQHNVAKSEVKSLYPQTISIKNTSEYKAIRINPSFRDQLITQKGEKQAQLAGELIQWDKIGLVLVSPMRRCLETCRRMLLKTQKKINVKVQPLLKGRLSNIWGYGSSTQSLKQLYPEYNFDRLLQVSEQSLPWYISIMSQQIQKKYKEHKQQSQALINSLEEEHQQFKTRIQKLKQVLDKQWNEKQTGTKILLISHSCVLRTINSKKFTEKGKGVSDIKFKNTKAVEISFDGMFPWLKQPKCQKECKSQASKQNK